MHREKLSVILDSFAKNFEYSPVIVKSLEKIYDINWSMVENSHDHFELTYIKKGDAVFKISDHDVLLGPNTLVLIKPKQRHKLIVKSATCELLVINFGFEQFLEISDVVVTESIDNMPFIFLKLGSGNEIISIIQRIIRERSKNRLYNEQITNLLVNELLLYVSRYYIDETKNKFDAKAQNVFASMQNAKNYIDKNYDKGITVKDVAKYVYLSDSYFTHTFKSTFGISPKPYVLQVQIEAAKDLLEKSDTKISDIAKAVGFSCQQRFNDIFKAITGSTPHKFRTQYKQSIVNKD